MNLFFTQMPKGGDIHHHYSGSIYAETYLDWLEQKNWYIDSCQLRIVKTQKVKKGCKALTVEELKVDDDLYRQLLMSWSDKDYANHDHQQMPPDSQFFSTFSYFSPISHEFLKDGMALLKKRALAENVSYIETMLSQVGLKSQDYFSSRSQAQYNKKLRAAKTQQQRDAIFSDIVTQLQKSKQFDKRITHFVDTVEQSHQGIDDKQFTMRFQTYGVRVLEPLQIFLDLYSGYLAAERSPLVVGVNIVAPENNVTALADYTLHMQMYHYLHQYYPKVNRALHAGELTLGMVRPKNLLFHINQARSIAKAQRIGHGVDIPYETKPFDLLADLKDNSAIEINLTSNQFILGVEKSEHPYLIYEQMDVPMVISTDDSGVSRNNLTNEYVLLASRYRPSYKRIKGYVYNSIEYSFLSEQDKMSAKVRLDDQFTQFEANIAGLHCAELCPL